MTIITYSLLWSLWGNYSSYILLNRLDIESQAIVEHSKLSYQNAVNKNTIAFNFYNTYSERKPINLSIKRKEFLKEALAKPTNNNLVDSINYYLAKSYVEHRLNSLTFDSYSCCFCYPDFYLANDSNDLYLGSPINFYYEPMAKYDLYIDGQTVSKDYKNGYIVPKSDSYNIEMHIIQVDRETGLLDTIKIEKVIHH